MVSATAYNNNKHLVESPSAPDVPYVAHATATPPVVQYHIHVAAPQVSTSAWETGLFECFCVPAHCCMAFFLPCISGAYAAHAIGQSWVLAGVFFLVMYAGESGLSIMAQLDSSNSDYYSYSYYYEDESFFLFSTYGILSLGCALGFVLGIMWLRVLTRKFFSLPGSSIEDCCASFWCSCCVLSQMSSHAEKVKNKSSANTLPAYHAA